MCQGVYPSDRLPHHPPKTTWGAYIVNTHPAVEPGQHWLGGVDGERSVQSIWQLRIASIRLRDTGVSRVDCAALDVRGAQRQDSASLRQPVLWPLCFPVPARESARADLVGDNGIVSGCGLRVERSSCGGTRTSVDPATSPESSGRT